MGKEVVLSPSHLSKLTLKWDAHSADVHGELTQAHIHPRTHTDRLI